MIPSPQKLTILWLNYRDIKNSKKVTLCFISGELVKNLFRSVISSKIFLKHTKPGWSLLEISANLTQNVAQPS